MKKISFSKFANIVTDFAGSKQAFVIAVALLVGWLIAGFFFKWSDSHSLFINTITTIITFLMVFIIQHSQNHDTKALHIKIDELIKAIKSADNGKRGIEKLDDEELEKVKRMLMRKTD